MKGDIAPTQKSGDCAASPYCVECREYSRPDNPDDFVYKCEIDNNGEFRYGNRCNRAYRNQCGDRSQRCMLSYSISEGLHPSNPLSACRDLPDALNTQIDSGDWEYNPEPFRKTGRGICPYCNMSGGDTCHESWIPGGEFNDWSGMFRCKRKV